MECSPKVESYARACELFAAEPERFHHIVIWLVLHAAAALLYVLAALVADRRFHKPLGWGYGTLGTSAVYVVIALELVEHNSHGQGGLGAMAWFFGIVIGIPAALLGAALTTWWMVGKAGLPTRAWALVCALAYVPLIAAHGFSHW
jgi:hypothetical protein